MNACNHNIKEVKLKVHRWWSYLELSCSRPHLLIWPASPQAKDLLEYFRHSPMCLFLQSRHIGLVFSSSYLLLFESTFWLFWMFWIVGDFPLLLEFDPPLLLLHFVLVVQWSILFSKKLLSNTSNSHSPSKGPRSLTYNMVLECKSECRNKLVSPSSLLMVHNLGANCSNCINFYSNVHTFRLPCWMLLNSVAFLFPNLLWIVSDIESLHEFSPYDSPKLTTSKGRSELPLTRNLLPPWTCKKQVLPSDSQVLPLP